MVISSYDYVLYYELSRSNNTVCPADTLMDMFDACIIVLQYIKLYSHVMHCVVIYMRN